MVASAEVDDACQLDTFDPSLPLDAAPPAARPNSNMAHPQAMPRTITPDHLLPYSSTSPLKRRLALPQSSRVDPAMVQRDAPTGGILGWGSKNWLSFVWFLGAKGFDIAGAMVRYGLFGAPRPSWGIECVERGNQRRKERADNGYCRMTVVCAFMRNLSAHSSLTDIVGARSILIQPRIRLTLRMQTLMRQLISVHYLLPLPPDAMVTPITFPIKKRSEPLRGFFTCVDSPLLACAALTAPT